MTVSAPSADLDTAEGGAFCRVVIAGPATRVDLALPTAVPLVALLPSIVTYAEQDPAALHGWALSRLDGTRLDPGAALAAAGVREGELLMLHPAHDSVGEPLYDDVVEVLGEGAAEAGWTERETRIACAALSALAVLAALWTAAAVGGVLAGVLIGVLALLLLAGGSALARATGDVRAAAVLATLSAVAGAACGTVLLGPPFGAAHLLLAATIVMLVAAAAPPLIGGGDGLFLGLGLAAALGLLGSVLALVVPASPARAAAVVAPLALALTTVMPTLALRLSRIPHAPLPRTAADLADVPGQLELDLVQHRVHRARALLSGLVIGCYAVTTTGIVVLTLDLTTPWPCVLAAILGVLLVLRARLFRRRSQVAAPLVAAATALVAGASAATTAWAPSAPVLLGAVAPVALGLAAAAGAFGVWGARRRLNPRMARALDLLETLLLLSVVPMILAVWDVYTALLEIRA
jgi:type VII secretion integral membrane protein EccD